MSIQSSSMDLPPAGSGVMTDSWRRQGAHPLTHLWFQRMERRQQFLLRLGRPLTMDGDSRDRGNNVLNTRSVQEQIPANKTDMY
ncbi:hypothetical protein F7725_023160 [Dissostichus mawsoni]|uniref:Uncharacterized protein n=1 Tax=Dissostichus mawsoni TaxID=36200 RepID=A0A7J5YZX6_DISMA|nr:hypothetical protein F7725_023160 [Dissostichus mawsoni]